MNLSITINGISLDRYVLLSTLLCSREDNIINDVPDRIVCKIQSISLSGVIDVYVHASEGAIKHKEYRRGTKIFHEIYVSKDIGDRFSFKDSHRILSMREVTDRDVPLFVNWKWMSDTFKREMFGV